MELPDCRVRPRECTALAIAVGHWRIITRIRIFTRSFCDVFIELDSALQQIRETISLLPWRSRQRHRTPTKVGLQSRRHQLDERVLHHEILPQLECSERVVGIAFAGLSGHCTLNRLAQLLCKVTFLKRRWCRAEQRAWGAGNAGGQG